MNGTTIHRLDNFAVEAAQLFARHCDAMIRQRLGRSDRSRIHVALTGGSAARELYRGLAQPEILAGFDASMIEFYQGDERPVAPSSPDSNWGMASATFLDPAGVPEEHRHRMHGESADLDAAAREYETLLRERLPLEDSLPIFDLVLLGMGPDGHIASLFPDTAALAETSRLVVANWVPKLNSHRLTVTYPVVNAARSIWLIVTGAEKAETVRRAIEQHDSTLPVSHITPAAGQLVWLLDQAAASTLSPASR